MYAIFIVIVIYLIVPLIGLGLFLRYRAIMNSSTVEDPPIIHFFFIFAYNASLAVALLTDLLWKASGLSVAGFALTLVTCPFVMGFIIYDLRKKWNLSIYHTNAYRMALLYFPTLVFVMIISAVFISITN